MFKRNRDIGGLIMNRDSYCKLFGKECNTIDTCSYFRDRFGTISYCLLSDKERQAKVEEINQKELQERENKINVSI